VNICILKSPVNYRILARVFTCGSYEGSYRGIRYVHELLEAGKPLYIHFMAASRHLHIRFKMDISRAKLPRYHFRHTFGSNRSMYDSYSFPAKAHPLIPSNRITLFILAFPRSLIKSSNQPAALAPRPRDEPNALGYNRSYENSPSHGQSTYHNTKSPAQSPPRYTKHKALEDSRIAFEPEDSMTRESSRPNLFPSVKSTICSLVK
jgi:hypothetical protein